jgi:FdhD protein
VIVPSRGSVPVGIRRVGPDDGREERDRVAAEEPMEIRVERVGPGGLPEIHQVAVTMRTPGDDFELAVGFLVSEGLLRGRRSLQTVTYCTGPETQEYNVVSVRLRPGAPFDPELLNRNFYTTSSCGVCGKASLDAVRIQGHEPFDPEEGRRWPPHLLAAAPARLEESQGVFRRTGGLHAAALVHPDGRLDPVREDVGRHNAVDKLVGHLFMEDRLPGTQGLLLVSGRASFEIMQKALAAGIPAVAAVGAPSSLAVQTAREFGMTLVGFLRPEGFNVYAGQQRIGEGGTSSDRAGGGA